MWAGWLRPWIASWPTPPCAVRLGAEGRRRFAEVFRHEQMTAQLRSLYQRLLGGG